MINSYERYLEYLEADRISRGRGKTLRSSLFDDIWRFQRLMRRLEYVTNCHKSCILRAFLTYRYRKLGIRLGYSIPINVFGPGLAIVHVGTIVVNEGARVGANCRLHAGVNIGTKAGTSSETPSIGDNCYIGPGVKMFGRIVIGPNMAIGANAVVNKSFPAGNATIGGIPAKIISSKTSEGLLVKGANVS